MKFYFLTTNTIFKLCACTSLWMQITCSWCVINCLYSTSLLTHEIWAAVLYTRSAFQPKFSVFVYLYCRHMKNGWGICSVLYIEYKEIFPWGPRGLIHLWRITTSLPRTVVIARLPLCHLEHPKRGVQAQGRLVLPIFRWADLSVWVHVSCGVESLNVDLVNISTVEWQTFSEICLVHFTYSP